jgi:hypothetical protein
MPLMPKNALTIKIYKNKGVLVGFALHSPYFLHPFAESSMQEKGGEVFM